MTAVRRNRWFKGLLALLTALPLLAFAQDQTRTPNPDEMLRIKSDVLSQGDSWNAVFIGSSRVQTQFVPSVFDDVMQSNGIDIRSYNLGAAGMTAAEVEYVARQVISEDTDGSLEWIFVFPEVIAPQITTSDFGSSRALAWHDAIGTLSVMGALRDSQTSDERIAEWARLHIAGLILNQTHLADASIGLSSVRDERKIAEVAQVAVLGPDSDGFVPLDWLAREFPNPSLDRRINEFSGAREAWESGIDELRDAYSAAARPSTETETDYLTRLQNLEQPGRRIVIVSPPSAADRTWVRSAVANGVVPVEFDYNNPDQFPELFDASLWFDKAHVNEDGARLFSRMFAEDFAAFVTFGG